MEELKTATEKAAIRKEIVTKNLEKRNRWWDSKRRDLKTEARKCLTRLKKGKSIKEEYCRSKTIYRKRCEERKEEILEEEEKNRSHKIRARGIAVHKQRKEELKYK